MSPAASIYSGIQLPHAERVARLTFARLDPYQRPSNAKKRPSNAFQRPTNATLNPLPTPSNHYQRGCVPTPYNPQALEAAFWGACAPSAVPIALKVGP
jgi:hypothetical protein